MNVHQINNNIHRRNFQAIKVSGQRIPPHLNRDLGYDEVPSEGILGKRQIFSFPTPGQTAETSDRGDVDSTNKGTIASTTTKINTNTVNTNTKVETTPPILPTSLNTPTTSTTRTSTTPPLIPPILPTTTSSTVIPTTTSTTSRTTSTTSTTTSTTPTTTSPLTPPTTSASPTLVVNTPIRNTSQQTQTIFSPASPSITAGSNADSNANKAQSGGSSTGAIVGGVMGGIAGIAVLCFLVAFVIRRVRNRHNEEDHFSAAQFRRSAVILDDDFTPDGRLQRGNSIGSNRAGYGSMGGGGYAAGERSLRPPTMIERHMANTPASAGVPPPMPAFNYNQQYGYEGQGYGQGYGYDQGYNTGFQTGEVMPGGATAPPESYGYSGEPAFLNRQRSMSSSGHGHSGYTDLQRNPSMNAGYADLQRNPSVGGYGSGYPVGEAMNAPMPIMSPPPPAAHIGSSAIASDISTTQASALAAAAAAARAGGRPSVEGSVERRPSKDGQVAAPPVKRPDTVYDADDAYGGM